MRSSGRQTPNPKLLTTLPGFGFGVKDLGFRVEGDAGQTDRREAALDGNLSLALSLSFPLSLSLSSPLSFPLSLSLSLCLTLSLPLRGWGQTDRRDEALECGRGGNCFDDLPKTFVNT